jgi:DNA-binding transcriptional ArsR family regulator
MAAADREIERAVAFFAALAHEGRLRALLALSRGCPLSVGALAEACSMEQSAMSHQLRLLKEARLVTAERDGKSVLYSLADHHVAHVVGDAIAHVSELKKKRSS